MELKHIILGLLSVRPMSGYDLGRAFSGSVAHFWHADQSQIYRTLDRLAEAGSITTEVIPQDGRPDRKLHSLTEDGYAELDLWLAGPAHFPKTKVPVLAQLFFAGRLGQDNAERILREHETAASQELEQLRGIDAPTDDELSSVLRAATLDYGITAVEAELTWIQELQSKLTSLKDSPHD